MGRPRTATAILDARGAFQKHPERKRVDAVVTSTLPRQAPAELTKQEVKWWHKLKKQIPPSVLTGADQASFHLLVVIWAEFIEDVNDFPTSKIAQLRGLMGDFGMTPSARAKLAIKPGGDDGAF